jgi:hypothetical protein
MADGMMLGWKRECADADELLRLMFPNTEPGDFRTDGGWINLSKVRDLWPRRNAGVPGTHPLQTPCKHCGAKQGEEHSVTCPYGVKGPEA